MTFRETSNTSVPPIKTCYVIPLQPTGDSGIQPCLYFDQNGDQYPLNTPLGGLGAPNPDLLRIMQANLSQLPASLAAGLPAIAVDESAHLYAAVAATFDEDYGLPTVFRASAAQSIVIPATDRTHRGVILVFAHKDANGCITLLRPTKDPVIGNSSCG